MIAIPLSVGVAVFITEMCPKPLRGTISFLTELLAAIPSVVYGLWAIFVLAPLLREHVQPWLAKYFGWTGLFSGPPFGIGMLAAGVILAIMIVPIIASITREVLTAVPQQQREAVLALGATRWEMIRVGVLRNARTGIVGAIILGLGRALGETMTVTMVIGNTPANRQIAIRSRLHHGQRDRQRIHRGHRRSVFERPDRDRAGAVSGDRLWSTYWPVCWFGRSHAACLRGSVPDDSITPKAGAGTPATGIPLERSPSQQRLLDLRRKLTDRLATGFAVLMAVLVIAPLLAVFTYLVLRGVGSLNLAFFTHLPVPVGEQGGGVANAIVGSG